MPAIARPPDAGGADEQALIRLVRGFLGRTWLTHRQLAFSLGVGTGQLISLARERGLLHSHGRGRSRAHRLTEAGKKYLVSLGQGSPV